MLSTATSSRPPALPMACCSACHQNSGATSVPSGRLVRQGRASHPVSASRMTTLQDWVDESTPATSVIVGSARAGKMLDRQLVQPDETIALLRGHVRFEVLEG